MRIVSFFLVIIGCAGSAPPQTSRVAELSFIVGCFASQEFAREAILELGLKSGETAQVRLGVGPIPGMTRGSTDRVQVIFYAVDGKRAWLGLADSSPGGKVTVWPNGYRLSRESDGRWSAGEGHGGIATYVAVGKYADGLDRQPAVKVPIRPVRDPDCSLLKL